MSDDARLYEAVRARLEHEDGLIVQRLSWLLASQSFLFTAYAIVLNGLAVGGKASATDRMRELFWILPAVGILSSALIHAGILAALAAMARLAADFAARVPDASTLGMPPLRTPAPIRRAGLAAPLALPVLFVAAWILLLVAP